MFRVGGHWKYVGEGGKNAIFACCAGSTAAAEQEALAEDEEQAKMLGRLLRIKKVDLAWSVHCRDDAQIDREKSVESNKTDDEKFREMICRILQPYADRPQSIDLNWHFLRELRQQALASGQIPPRRRNDWSTDERTVKTNMEGSPVGLLLWDYRISFPSAFTTQRTYDNHQLVVSIEIKPKAGYRAFSPLVVPTRRAKFTTTRFALHQRLYCEGKLKKDWMGESDNTAHKAELASSYDPLDLFSSDILRIKRALCALFVSPQNNLTIRVNESVLVSEQSQDGDRSPIDWDLVRQALGLTSTDVGEVHLQDMATAVLAEEDFLSRVLSFQKLDILDADGAICVYNRLNDLCEGNHDAAEDLVDTVFSVTSYLWEQPHSILKTSPLEPPSACKGINILCREIERLSCLLDPNRESIPFESELDGLQDRAIDIVQTLTKDECRYLLQVWLLSLTMCDFSFFLTFRLNYEDNAQGVGTSRKPASAGVRSGLYQVHTRQSDTCPGLIIRRSEEHNGSVSLQYQLKIVDFDQKPAQKLSTRSRKETILDNMPIGACQP